MSEEAERLGVTGWVRNRRDGTVEAGLGGRAPAFLHAGGESVPAAGRCVLARARLVGVIARRHCDGEDDEHAERAQAALRTSHPPALRRPASPPRSPSRIASARAMEKSRVLRSKAFALSGIM